jgi:hypothetical protein
VFWVVWADYVAFRAGGFSVAKVVPWGEFATKRAKVGIYLRQNSLLTPASPLLRMGSLSFDCYDCLQPAKFAL